MSPDLIVVRSVSLQDNAQVRFAEHGFESQLPAGATIEERLVSVGTDILGRLLVSEVIDFMRLAIAEARRFPDLANVGRMARERGAQAVTQVLSKTAHLDEIEKYSAFAPEFLAATTGFLCVPCSAKTSSCYARRSTLTLHAALRSFSLPAATEATIDLFSAVSGSTRTPRASRCRAPERLLDRRGVEPSIMLSPMQN